MNKLLDYLERIIDSIQILLLFLIVGSIGMQIVSRKLFNRPFDFPEELSMFTLIAVVFIGISVIERHNMHVKVEFIYERVSPLIRKLLTVSGKILMFLVVICILLGEHQLIPRIIKLTSKAAGIPYIWVHGIMAVSCFLWALAIGVSTISILKRNKD